MDKNHLNHRKENTVMTQEEKARAYDKTIKKLREFYRDYDTISCLIDVKEELANLFPELVESEDKRICREIREFIVNFYNGNYEKPYDYTIGTWVAWLEMQGDTIKIIKKDKNYLCTKTHKYAGVEWIEGVKYYSPEDYSLVNQGCTYYCPFYSKEEHNNFFKEVEYDGCLEKQGEWKTIDKVEPNFKVGDWVISKYMHLIMQILNNDNGYYKTVETDGTKRTDSYDFIDRNFKFWTIQDAKPGDVLFSDLMNGKTFIYNGVNSDEAILYSFIISNDGEDVLPYHIGKPNTGIGNIEENKNIIYPATKEQRDFLFSKMKEAGYEWDDKKKELKKIEQSELTEFEDAVKDMMNAYRDAIGDNDVTTEEVKKHATYLLSLISHKPTE